MTAEIQGKVALVTGAASGRRRGGPLPGSLMRSLQIMRLIFYLPFSRMYSFS